MNNQLIEKVIKSNDANPCPEFIYQNPLLDRNVAGALAKSFIKILKVSQKNSNINNNLRHSVLANIRKVCRVEPENHLEISETVTNLLTEVYIEQIEDLQTNSYTDRTEKNLDDFIIQKLVQLDVNSNFKSSLNPEIAQSLINLNEKSLKVISQNVLDIDVTRKKGLTLIKDLWTKPISKINNIGDISRSMKPVIEQILLNACHTLLTKSINLNELLLSDNMRDLIQKCSISPECFQICFGILNCLFITINYNLIIQSLITEFINKIKETCLNISVLYPAHLSHIVVLLNININLMPKEIKDSYIQKTIPFLKTMHLKSESDFIMLLTHYPDWFDIYFDY